MKKPVLGKGTAAKPAEANLKRRKFLLAVGAGGAGVAAAAAALVGGEALIAKPAAEERGRGYRLTEHVRNYYRTTRI